MTEQNSGDAKEGKSSRSESSCWVKTSWALAFALVGLYGVYKVAERGDGQIEVGLDAVKIAFNKGDSLSDLINRAIAERPGTFRSLLAEHDFYDIQDVRWTNRLRERTPPLSDDVQDSIRSVLYDLAGPFDKSMALAGADARFYDAVTALDEKLRLFEPNTPQASANAFFTAIWRHQLNQSGVFEPRTFSANVTNLEVPSIIDGDRRHAIYVCTNELEDRDITLVLNEPDRLSRVVLAVGMRDPVQFPCSEATDDLSRYLARQSARLGLPRESFKELYGEAEEGATLPPRAAARFQIAPRFYMPVRPVRAEGG